MERGAWKSNTGFVLAAVGSAVGLGNIWRFSYMVHENGGALFLLPYIIALLIVGIPILILEFAIGHKMRASAPQSMHTIHSEWEWLGWWPVIFVMFGINLYYVVIIAWCALYMLNSLRSPLPWAEGSEAFFDNQFLRISDSVFVFDGIRWPILLMTVVIWFLLWFICIRRIDRGVEVACKIFMPALLFLVTILVIWGLTLDGAIEGIEEYVWFTRDDLPQLAQIHVWRAAFSQIFFTLSIGFGIMIAYASYLPKKTDLVGSAFIIALADCGFSIFAGFAVFSVLGFMAYTEGVTVAEVVASGPGLSFVVYPEAIALLPGGNHVFGFFFFLALTIAGLTSAMSIVEAFSSAAVDKFGWKRRNVVSVSCLVGAFGSIVFTTGAGFYWLDIVDRFLNQYGLILVGLLECILVIWYYRIDKLHFHLYDANEGGYPPIWDIWWEWSVKYVVPLVLFIILAWSAIEDISTPYGDYPSEAIMMIGMGWLVATFLAAGVFSVYTRHRDNDRLSL